MVSFASREDDLVADFKLGGVVFPPSISFLIERFGFLVRLESISGCEHFMSIY